MRRERLTERQLALVAVACLAARENAYMRSKKLVRRRAQAMGSEILIVNLKYSEHFGGAGRFSITARVGKFTANFRISTV